MLAVKCQSCHCNEHTIYLPIEGPGFYLYKWFQLPASVVDLSCIRPYLYLNIRFWSPSFVRQNATAPLITTVRKWTRCMDMPVLLVKLVSLCSCASRLLDILAWSDWDSILLFETRLLLQILLVLEIRLLLEDIWDNMVLAVSYTQTFVCDV